MTTQRTLAASSPSQRPVACMGGQGVLPPTVWGVVEPSTKTPVFNVEELALKANAGAVE
jgi:hypothetical protein